MREILNTRYTQLMCVVCTRANFKWNEMNRTAWNTNINQHRVQLEMFITPFFRGFFKRFFFATLNGRKSTSMENVWNKFYIEEKILVQFGRENKKNISLNGKDFLCSNVYLVISSLRCLNLLIIILKFILLSTNSLFQILWFVWC